MLRVLRGFEKARVYEIEIPRVRQNNTEEQLLMNRAQDNKLPTEVDFSFNLTTIPARWYFQVQQRNTYILRQTRGRNTFGRFMLTKRTISTGLMGTGLERRLEEMLKS